VVRDVLHAEYLHETQLPVAANKYAPVIQVKSPPTALVPANVQEVAIALHPEPEHPTIL